MQRDAVWWAAATVSLENLQILPFSATFVSRKWIALPSTCTCTDAHARMHTHRPGTFVRCSTERRSRSGCFFPPPLYPRQLWFLVFIVSLPRLCCWSGFALIVRCPSWPRSWSLISMLPTHLGRFVAFFQNISSLLQVMSTLLQLCHHNYWPKSVPSHHFPVAVFSMGTNWGTVPKVSCVGIFGRGMFSLHSRRCRPSF